MNYRACQFKLLGMPQIGRSEWWIPPQVCVNASKLNVSLVLTCWALPPFRGREGNVFYPCTGLFKIALHQTQMSPTLISFWPFPLLTFFRLFPISDISWVTTSLDVFPLAWYSQRIPDIKISLLRKKQNQKAFRSGKITYPFQKRIEKRCTLKFWLWSPFRHGK